MNQPLVSVCTITYNQELYIRECIRSILCQRCNFDVEIILNDDNSSDGTSEICGNIIHSGGVNNILYQRNASNLGMMGNWINSLSRCRGKYIALCEGDDYWTDSQKLQKQVDFLESHPEYVGCFHNTEERYEDDEQKASYLYCNFPSAREISFADLCYGNLIPTCSVVYRNKLFDDFPGWYRNLKMCDWPMHLLNAQYGNFWYIPKVMGVHRLHRQSVWMLQDPEINKKYIIDAYTQMIEGYKHKIEQREQLIKAKEYFINPPKSNYKPSIARRGINFIKRIIEHKTSIYPDQDIKK